MQFKRINSFEAPFYFKSIITLVWLVEIIKRHVTDIKHVALETYNVRITEICVIRRRAHTITHICSKLHTNFYVPFSYSFKCAEFRMLFEAHLTTVTHK